MTSYSFLYIEQPSIENSCYLLKKDFTYRKNRLVVKICIFLVVYNLFLFNLRNKSRLCALM